MRGLGDKVVVVAGGGGIGSATVHRLADAGARVLVGDLDGEHALALADAVREAGASASACAWTSATRVRCVRWSTRP